MTADRWRQIEDLFAQAVDCPPSERAAFLDRVCGGDTALRRELDSLLASDAPEERLVEIPSGFADGACESELAADMVGRRIGSYRLTRLIGHGGMGAVYLGVRADDQFEKQVAIKLLKRGMDTGLMLDRFRQERQILATLEHPFIARLIDGGATEDGLPYFVLEYVEGVPITKHCAERNLSVADRVRLFRLVCEAVQYAHQNLVVHRDIKPSNILTTREGIPKLLDFGIAKVLDPRVATDVTATRREFRMMTPDYASPEQVRGIPVTTASDTYSLGAVLYELLTGQRPHRFPSDSLADMEATICEVEPQKPSIVAGKQLRRQLSGDLDNIVLTAMRKEPQRRYASAAEFAEDLRRQLEGLPVLAREDRWGYRVGKFVRRHKLTVGAAALVVASLVGGIVATTIQARRAERRFQIVRGLAHGVLFDLYEEMERLPGSTALRAATIQTVVKYLDDLARDGPQDAELDIEIATAYERVASLEGHPFMSNLGRGSAALSTYRKALAIYERLATGGENRDQVVRGLIDTHLGVSGMEAMLGNPSAADLHSQKAAAIAQEVFSKGDPAIPPGTQTNVYFRLADAEYQRGSASGELAFYRKALEVSRAWVAAENSPEATDRMIESSRNAASALARSGDLAGALRSYQDARIAAEELARRKDFKQDHLYGAIGVVTSIGDILAAPDDPNFGDIAGAKKEYLEALRISEGLAGADSKNVNARRIVAGCCWRLGMLLREKQPDQAVDYCGKALRIAEELSAGDPRNTEYRYHASRALLWMGEALRTLRRYDEAVASLRRALELQHAIAAVSPERIWNLRPLSRTYAALGDALRGRGDYDRARHELGEGLAVADRMLQRAPSSLPHQLDRADVLEAMGRYYVALARRPGEPASRKAESTAEARSCYQKSLAIWREWEKRKIGSPYAGRRMNRVLAALASID